MKIAYVTSYDARDVRNWSGIGYYMARALEQQALCVDYVGPLRKRDPRQLYFYAKKLVYEVAFKEQYLPSRETSILKSYARQAAERVSTSGVDVIFSPGTLPIAYLESRQPIMFWTDATFERMLEFYPELSNLCREMVDKGHAMEANALQRAALAIYSSDWAADSAIQYYGVPRSKVRVVPFGANIEAAPAPEDIRSIVERRSSSTCKLLFLGVDWLRKGGDIAVEVARSLIAAGLPTELIVVGCEPQVGTTVPSFVRGYGRISKRTPDGLAQLHSLLAESHFLLVPTRADCTPIVFCESNAFAVPSLSARVGGIPSLIRDGINGRTFSKDAPISAYCEYIYDLFSNPQHYRDLALSSFNEYCSRLNWSTGAATVKRMLEELIS